MLLQRKMIALLALLMFVLSACAPVMPAASAGAGLVASTSAGYQSEQGKIIRFQVAEDGNRFVFSQERLFDDGMPQYGTPFVTQGYLYPEGTLNGSNGVLADGQPEFPDQVIGEWTCYGWMIGDGGHTESGEWVVSTQIYKFYGEEGGILVTDGFELVDFDVPVARAITSGTGAYQNVSGEQVQTLLGFTEQMGVNLTVELQLD
jgi:hypothetical protein